MRRLRNDRPLKKGFGLTFTWIIVGIIRKKVGLSRVTHELKTGGVRGTWSVAAAPPPPQLISNAPELKICPFSS